MIGDIVSYKWSEKDGSYTIGAIDLPRDKSPEVFEEEAKR